MTKYVSPFLLLKLSYFFSKLKQVDFIGHASWSNVFMRKNSLDSMSIAMRQWRRRIFRFTQAPTISPAIVSTRIFSAYLTRWRSEKTSKIVLSDGECDISPMKRPAKLTRKENSISHSALSFVSLGYLIRTGWVDSHLFRNLNYSDLSFK